ncbi:ABC transporter permease subunit [Halobaculum limi]|uniref:ABC transporter permease subunit n=1 Tax=Halobaculum limi TaxID=3031916 RepID=UPI002405533B|nr:ABC transporter permease subunit [Halobaculum sp. YSMS11]
MSGDSADSTTATGSEQATASTREVTTDSPILAVARYEGERLLVPTAAATVALSLFGSLYVWLGPQVTAGVPIEELTEAIPPALRALFGLESLGSVEGLLASEFYTLGWIVGLAGYVAYVAAVRVAGDVATDRMDLLLVAPARRSDVLAGKYLALLVPIVVVNAVVPVALYGVSLAVDASLSLSALAVFHALSVPYLLLWGAVGLLLGTVVDGGRTAGRVGLGVVFAAWIVEAVVVGSALEWVGALSPARYLDPTAIIVRGEYDLGGVVLLGVATVAVLVVSVVAFERRDV